MPGVRRLLPPPMRIENMFLKTDKSSRAEQGTTDAVVVHEAGGPEKMCLEKRPLLPLKAGEVRVRHVAIGLNFIDIYYRTGIYKAPSFPFVPGQEASGVVEEIGSGVAGLSIGDRVAYATEPLGAYAGVRTLPADRLVRLPDAIDFPVAAAMMLKGLTARYLLRKTISIQQGDVILFHAVAGGVGLIACQWARHLGAVVIGTVGDDDKEETARANGCSHVINYRRENFVERVREITGGTGVSVVYDSVGKETFTGSLDCLEPRGLLVSFGQSSGVVPPLDILQLSAKGSLFLTRPVLNTYLSTQEELQLAADDLFFMVMSGAVKISINQIYPLSEAVRAHRDLESRRTTGSSILIP
ncbi:MAG: quinone oxidoreductase [Chitinispirillaceae bacterium]|nr:quinone oxidoreductase [Chitinispirillaceae bacterium]